MARYEYKIVMADSANHSTELSAYKGMTQVLDEFDADGWELVGHVEPILYPDVGLLHFVATMRRERQEKGQTDAN